MDQITALLVIAALPFAASASAETTDVDHVFVASGGAFIDGCGNGVAGLVNVAGVDTDGAWDLSLQALRPECGVAWERTIVDAAWQLDPGGCIEAGPDETVCMHGPYQDLFVPPYTGFDVTWTRGEVTVESFVAAWFPSCVLATHADIGECEHFG